MVIANEGNKNSVNSIDSVNLDDACACSDPESLSSVQNVGCVCGCHAKETRSSSEQSGRN